MRGQVRWWSFVYTILFALAAVEFVQSDMDAHYNRNWIYASFASYTLMIAGDLIYSLRIPSGKIKWLWALLLLCFFGFFIATGYMDDDLRHLCHTNPRLAAVIWFLNFLLFAPTFWANYRIVRPAAKRPGEFDKQNAANKRRFIRKPGFDDFS